MNENEKPKPKTGFGYRALSIKEVVTLEDDLEHNHYRKRERHRSDHCYAEITNEELGNMQSPRPSSTTVVTSSKRGETRSLLQTLVDSTKKANSPLPTPISNKPFVLPKSSPALFVTPGPGTPCLTPGGRSPYHSLFNSPKEDKFATAQTPLNRYSTNAIEGRHAQLSREDSAKRDAERLREIMQPHLVRKQQLNEDDSLQLAEAFSKVSPKKGKKRTSDGVAKQNVFVDDTPIPTRARSHSTASADGTTSTSGTPQKQKKKKRKSASANTSSEDATNDATNDAPDFAGSPSKIFGPLSKTKEKVKPRTKWQLLLDKTKQESKIEQRDINRVSRVFREGK